MAQCCNRSDVRFYPSQFICKVWHVRVLVHVSDAGVSDGLSAIILNPAVLRNVLAASHWCRTTNPRCCRHLCVTPASVMTVPQHCWDSVMSKWANSVDSWLTMWFFCTDFFRPTKGVNLRLCMRRACSVCVCGWCPSILNLIKDGAPTYRWNPRSCVDDTPVTKSLYTFVIVSLLYFPWSEPVISLLSTAPPLVSVGGILFTKCYTDSQW